MTPCGALNCSEHDVSGKDLIACRGVCGKSFHPICMGLSRTSTRSLSEISKCFYFFCSECELISVPTLVTQLSDNIKIINSLTIAIDNVHHSLDALHSKININHNTLSGNVDDLNGFVDKIGANLSNISSRSSVMDSKLDKILQCINYTDSEPNVLDNINFKLTSISDSVKIVHDLIRSAASKGDSGFDQSSVFFSNVESHFIETSKSLLSLTELLSTQSSSQPLSPPAIEALGNIHSEQLASRDKLKELCCLIERAVLEKTDSQQPADDPPPISATRNSVPLSSLDEEIRVVDHAFQSAIRPLDKKSLRRSRTKRRKSHSASTNYSRPLSNAVIVSEPPPDSNAAKALSRPLRAVSKLRTLFVSQLHPHTSVFDVLIHLESNSKINIKESGISCSKIRSDRFSSFKIRVPDDLFLKLLSPDLWPTGSLVKEFIPRGTPRLECISLAPKNW